MEQFLDYRQVPTATEANENTESIKENGHVEKVNKEPNGQQIQQKGLLHVILFMCYYRRYVSAVWCILLLIIIY